MFVVDEPFGDFDEVLPDVGGHLLEVGRRRGVDFVVVVGAEDVEDRRWRHDAAVLGQHLLELVHHRLLARFEQAHLKKKEPTTSTFHFLTVFLLVSQSF